MNRNRAFIIAALVLPLTTPVCAQPAEQDKLLEGFTKDELETRPGKMPARFRRQMEEKSDNMAPIETQFACNVSRYYNDRNRDNYDRVTFESSETIFADTKEELLEKIAKEILYYEKQDHATRRKYPSTREYYSFEYDNIYQVVVTDKEEYVSKEDIYATDAYKTWEQELEAEKVADEAEALFRKNAEEMIQAVKRKEQYLALKAEFENV